MESRHIASGRCVVALGVSRDGYVAFRAALSDPRITHVIALSPVTDLQRLEEFSHIKVNEAVYGLDAHASELGRKHLFIQIGSSDTRVGTHEAIELADGIARAARPATVDMTFIVTPRPGHATAEHDRAAQWAIDECDGRAGRSEAGTPTP